LIQATHLRKTFLVPERSPGLWAGLRSIFDRKTKEVVAVDDVSFAIEPGERVGFLGPNGAGKTTTLKMLAGLLRPSAEASRVQVGGFEPAKRSTAFLESISLVLGQKQQLIWDLPPAETFELNRVVYGIERTAFEKTKDELVDLLEIGAQIRRPARQLSLGERMKCELCCALLHRPKYLFLDEPTIGLDVNVQEAVRGFIRRYNEQTGATLLLTSHYMADVAALCPRILVIDKGKLVFDGALDALPQKLGQKKRVRLVLSRPVAESRAAQLGSLLEFGPGELTFEVTRSEVSVLVARALELLPVQDLSVIDPPLEEVLGALFRSEQPS
jgi:ABC-2 type transport system ATP-binding protein